MKWRRIFYINEVAYGISIFFVSTAHLDDSHTESNITEQITTLGIHTYFTVCVSHL